MMVLRCPRVHHVFFFHGILPEMSSVALQLKHAQPQVTKAVMGWGNSCWILNKHASSIHFVLEHPFPTLCTSGAWHLFSSSLLPWAFQARDDGSVKPKIPQIMFFMARWLTSFQLKDINHIICDGCIMYCVFQQPPKGKTTKTLVWVNVNVRSRDTP